MIQSTLNSCIGESRLTWDMNHDNLPHELSLDNGKKILSLRWSSICNDQGFVDQVVVVIRDETEQKIMEKNLAREKEEKFRNVEKLMEIIGPASKRIIQYFANIETRLQKIAELVDSDQNWEAVARDLHTVKGEARTLGLRGLASKTHDLESHIDVKSRSKKASFLMVYAAWRDEIKTYSDLCLKFSQRTQIEVPRFTLLVDETIHGAQNYARERELVISSLKLSDDVVNLPEERIDDLRAVLLHAVTNSIDHGFVFPRKRGQMQRHQVELEFGLSQEPGHIKLTIADNGAGLDKKALKKLAESLPTMSPSQKIEDLAFMAGVSTAEQVSETSGRGVGLAAIQAIAHKWGGQVSIGQRNGLGTILTLTWASQALPQSARTG